MTSATASSWPSSSPWRSGDIGWRARSTFIVWTVHRNLAYIQSARRLNSRQARWALFFGCFNFSLTHRPGSQNVKPVALSRLYSPEDPCTDPETILPPACQIATLTLSPRYASRRDSSQAPAPKSLVRSGRCTVQGTGQGPFLQAHLPPRNRPHFGLHPLPICWSTMDADVRAFIVDHCWRPE